MSLFTFILILFSLFICNLSYELSESKKNTLHEMLKSQTKLAKLHTLGIIITNKTSTIYEKIYGEDETITQKSKFIIGSVTKSFTAMAILKLEIPLNKTLGEFDLDDYINEEHKSISIFQLLSHTSGLESFGRKILYEKGTYHYSNYGFSLLGKIIELTCGKSYHECMKELIFDPLEMYDTNAKYHEDIVDSYDNFLGFRTKYTGLKSEIGNGFIIPAGYISTTIDDMGKYLRLYLNKDLEKNQKFHIDKMINKSVEIEYNNYYGFGIIVGTRNNQRVYQHNGASNSFLCQFYIYPDSDLAFFVITNTCDKFCLDPIINLVANVEKLLLLDFYESIGSSFFFYMHFALDMIFLLVLAVPIIYLIITIVRKVKKKDYTWFKGIKGIIIFIIDLLLLIIIPIIAIFLIYFASADFGYMIDNIKDLKFVVFTGSSALFLTFIIKLVYALVFNKYLKTLSMDSNSKLAAVDLDYMGVDDYEK